MNGMHLEIVERLNLHEQFRLVEIAHETTNSEIRSGALKVLAAYLNPLMVAVADSSRPLCDGSTAKPQ